MVETFKTFTQWLKRSFGASPPVVKILAPLVGLGLVTLLVMELPAFSKFEQWYRGANPTAQAGVLMLILLYVVYCVITLWERTERVTKLKAEKDKVQEALAAREQEVTSLRKELSLVEDRLSKLAQSEEAIWGRPDPGKNAFVAKDKRPTRFVAFLNLKGGVGKTTLTANLAACLGMAESHPLRVLVVDLDFQGTLSDHCVAPDLLILQRTNANTSTQLLDPETDVKGICRLATRMNKIPKVDVIVADDNLERSDFRAQARFFLDAGCEVRFLFQRMHDSEIHQRYDVVLFDCPPRLTTSSVNALACSDYVVIPTKLDDNSVNAVPRTIKWMNSLRHVSRAELLGVVANETTYYNGKLTKLHRFSYDYLCDITKTPTGCPVFKSSVKYDSHTTTQGQGVVGSVNPAVRALFSDFAQEFRQRLGI